MSDTKLKIGDVVRIIRRNDRMGWCDETVLGQCYRVTDISPHVRLYIDEHHTRWAFPLECIERADSQLLFEFMYDNSVDEKEG